MQRFIGVTHSSCGGSSFSPTVPNEKCPDGNKCDDEQTCCQLRSGSYGCCPYHHAVCCDDKVHCCPEGYKCDAKADRCINGNLTASPMSRIIQKRISRPANRILVDGNV
ncbi:hypothetical protein HPB51_008607 [Rhipicephalus microplus]|uniref:Granulins domain-containing protein n=1 Tax=Rhipicephalus microplus TaxID=6941 RepID=A0A9J6ENV2_RHIMP|nr:hypothetical protein HPB51_008607 [Rhipicephalus microplus]